MVAFDILFTSLLQYFYKFNGPADHSRQLTCKGLELLVAANCARRAWRRIDRLTLSDLNKLVLVLVRPRNPLNIGAAARAMTNFGARRLRVVNPYRLAFREAKSAVGASSVLRDAEEYESVVQAVGDCSLVVGTTAVRHRTLHQPLRTLGQDSGQIVRSELEGGLVALLFGSEKIGSKFGSHQKHVETHSQLG